MQVFLSLTLAVVGLLFGCRCSSVARQAVSATQHPKQPQPATRHAMQQLKSVCLSTTTCSVERWLQHLVQQNTTMFHHTCKLHVSHLQVPRQWQGGPQVQPTSRCSASLRPAMQFTRRKLLAPLLRRRLQIPVHQGPLVCGSNVHLPQYAAVCTGMHPCCWCRCGM
jgi:hypothetical protein